MKKTALRLQAICSTLPIEKSINSNMMIDDNLLFIIFSSLNLKKEEAEKTSRVSCIDLLQYHLILFMYVYAGLTKS
ncbi:CLUMA_CG018406, isoform A [Clunio marinus]|uniref:CLUMA_CG018406, isoform A n=1 Tax=Clunio marinus TaxID=568069 RepID=A0A1J1IYH9_9DIPT|nr:CLUMA_CG018406, isoform A [Clunio marinus]